MSETASYHLRKLKKQFLLKRCVEIVLWSIAITIIIYGSTWIFGASRPAIYAAVGFMVVTVFLFFVLKLNKISEKTLLGYLNQKYPELEESADLILKDPASLSTLESIQLTNTLSRIERLAPTIKLPHNIGKAGFGLAGSIVLGLLMSALDFRSDVRSLQKQTQNAPKANDSRKSPAPAAVAELNIKIIPPTYTGQRPFSVNQFDFKVPEGSVVSWNVTFNQTIARTLFSFTGKDSIELKPANGLFQAQQKLLRSSIYQLVWTDSMGNSNSSDFYQIEVAPDKTPEITFLDLRQSIELKVTDKPAIELKAKISDDYLVSNAYIIATVAKGSGESVKFREEKLTFSRPEKFNRQAVVAERTIDITRLGLEPGDELYFYGEVLDNRQPIPNRSRTETFFITLLDTAEQESVVDAGLGVDLMPEYFRSQRQIIMDTEKLLRNKKSLSKKEFNFLSNELGYDQKVLRLKYGEFLGEEFESELAPSDEGAEAQVETVIEEAKEGEEDMAEKFGHAHDKDNDHNLVEDKKPGHDHEHGEAKDPEAKENPLEAFVHAHDDAEEATFFLQSVRTKLKAALTEMWDAELYLRLYQPEKSLPFQYKALKLLKEVSNDSRIYVHKTGFDPPPIKEEKRLSGDLAEIKNSKRDALLTEEPQYPAVKDAVRLIGALTQQESIILSPREKEMLNKAGQEITELALQKPAQFLPALSLIKNIGQNAVRAGEMKSSLIALQKILYAALPKEQTQAFSASGSANALDQSFINNLQKLKND
ncbi:MAG TPA: DUF4175 family protein [Chryseosolibacter sp.]